MKNLTAIQRQMNRSPPIDYDYLYKVVVVGPSGCGKSSLLTRLIDHKFVEKHVSTIGVDFKTETIDVQLESGVMKTVKLQIWDTAGQERFHSIASQYYRGAHCVLFVYSFDDIKSIETLPKFIQEVEPFNVSHRILVGNKSDIKDEARQVQDTQIKHLKAENPGIKSVTTSAKTGENVSEAFHDLATELAELQASGRFISDAKDPLRLPSPRQNDEVVTESRKCCGGS